MWNQKEGWSGRREAIRQRVFGGYEERRERFGRPGCGAEHQGGGHGRWPEGREHRHGGFGGGRGGFERGFGRGRERLFDAGDVKLLIVQLLSEEPSYGYQLMKRMEQRLAGGYTPSAGVVYPTLTMLEEEGLATASTSETGKKVYRLTDAGREFLEANKRRVEELLARLDEAGSRFERGRSPEIMRAFMNLRGAVAARMARGNATAEQLKKIAEAVDAAAKSIDEL
jgi:DNA-binding PadR family transcriptional regulator